MKNINNEGLLIITSEDIKKLIEYNERAMASKTIRNPYMTKGSCKIIIKNLDQTEEMDQYQKGENEMFNKNINDSITKPKNEEKQKMINEYNNLMEQYSLELIKKNGYLIRFIENPSEEIQLEAVRQNPMDILYIKHPTEKVQIEAVRQDASIINYIDSPTEKVQIEAVRQDGSVVNYIKNPSQQVQLEAIRQQASSVLFTENQPSKVLIHVIEKADIEKADIEKYNSDTMYAIENGFKKHIVGEHSDYLKEKIDCKLVAENVLKEVKKEIEDNMYVPKVLIIQVGNRSDSTKYIKNKRKTCSGVGIQSSLIILPEKVTERQLIDRMKQEESNYDAIIVQCPLPKHINEQHVTNMIPFLKDCDGLNYCNIGYLHSQQTPKCIMPATAQGILNMLDFYDVDVSGLDILLIGRSNLVNRPLYEALCQRNATVTLAHSKTKNLQNKLSSGDYDIVIGAIGKAKELKNVNTNMIIDVGINFDENNKLCGDFDISSCNCDVYTTVPGGCGVLTTSAIVSNILKCYKMSH